ncbi:MAG: hypothetical protein CMF69_11565 [Magnetovibrio sp.]|nr:hypothetical protein [Magnetovibrio sp.]
MMKKMVLQSTEHYRRRKETGDVLRCPRILETGERCPYTTPYGKSSLKIHICCFHDKEKRYKCPECGKCHAQKGNLDKHRQREHGVPRPSTRATRHRERMSMPPIFRCVWYLEMLNRKMRERGKMVERKRLYEAMSDIYDKKPDILKDGNFKIGRMAEDMRSGYINYGWAIENIHTKKIFKDLKKNKSGSYAKKVANFMNYIHTLRHIYKKDSAAMKREMEYLYKDYNKSPQEIMDAMANYLRGVKNSNQK